MEPAFLFPFILIPGSQVLGELVQRLAEPALKPERSIAKEMTEPMWLTAIVPERNRPYLNPAPTIPAVPILAPFAAVSINMPVLTPINQPLPIV